MLPPLAVLGLRNTDMKPLQAAAERLMAGRELRDPDASAAAVPALLNQATISAWAARRFCRRLWSSPG